VFGYDKIHQTARFAVTYCGYVVSRVPELAVEVVQRYQSAEQSCGGQVKLAPEHGFIRLPHGYTLVQPSG